MASHAQDGFTVHALSALRADYDREILALAKNVKDVSPAGRRGFYLMNTLLPDHPWVTNPKLRRYVIALTGQDVHTLAHPFLPESVALVMRNDVFVEIERLESGGQY